MNSLPKIKDEKKVNQLEINLTNSNHLSDKKKYNKFKNFKWYRPTYDYFTVRIAKNTVESKK